MSVPRLSRWLTILGMLSLVLYAVIACLSQSFSYGHGYQDRPILGFVGVYGLVFIVYAVAVWRVKRQATEAVPFTLVLIFAALFRLVVLFSEPIQEDDFYRYLWDGKVVASGLNPYRFTPREVQTGNGKEGPLQPYRELTETDARFALLLSRVNHPDVPTLYPPVAQAVFGLAALIAPGSLLALRLIFFCFDLAVCGVIVKLLCHLGRSPLWVLIYAWSPLVIKETINSSHYDVVPTFLLVLALLALVTGRLSVGFLSLGGAILGRVFPVVLLPLFACHAWSCHGLGKAWGGLVLTSLVVACGYAPFAAAGSGLWQGFVTFAEHWQTNSFVFPLLHQMVTDRWLANGIVAGCLAGAVWVALRWNSQGNDVGFLRGCFFVMGTLLLLSPVGNPWYFLWVLPFVCLFPRVSWLLLSGLLGLYYTAFYFLYRGEPEMFRWVVWLEYLPFYAVLAWEAWRTRMGRTTLV
ncbi:MAG: hypothetical protein OXC18_22035 [Desulfurellaceae bacterium]|nr:hypothetical protein [Desulfurellaceae bacterium]